MDSVSFNKNSFYCSNQANDTRDTRKKDADSLNESTAYLTRNYIQVAAISTVAAALIAGVAIALYQYAPQSEGSFVDPNIKDLTKLQGEEIPEGTNPVNEDGLKIYSQDKNLLFQNNEPVDFLLKLNATITKADVLFEKCIWDVPDEKYEGDCVNGQKHGYGVLKWQNGDVYEGKFENGKMHGQGKWISKDGYQYEGEYVNGQRHGYGVLTWPNGDVYEGKFENDLFHGYGEVKTAGGEIYYQGEFKDDKFHGYGVITFEGGDVYEGQFENLLYHGFGVYTWPDGRVYTGQFKDDKFHGYGVYTWPNGDVYNGYFKNDLKHGQGKMTYADGRSYEGSWKNNTRDGLGTLKWKDGAFYVGDFENNLRHGRGNMTYQDSSGLYEGSWVNDEKDGYGELTKIDGAQFKGRFHKNKMGEGQWIQPTLGFFHTGLYPLDRPS